MMNKALFSPHRSAGITPVPQEQRASRLHWLLFSIWLVGSLLALGAFEYQDAVRGQLCGG